MREQNPVRQSSSEILDRTGKDGHSGVIHPQRVSSTAPPRRLNNNRNTKASEFLALEEPHPYGILPGGNRFDGSSSCTAAASGLALQARLNGNDELWQTVLGFCDGSTLGATVQSCRYLYAAGHQPELWRDLVLRHCDTRDLTIQHMGGLSWKDTFVLLISQEKASETDPILPSSHRPMAVPGIYSDYLYRTHLCRSFAIPSSWLNVACDGTDENSVISVSASDMGARRFLEVFERPNRPVVIRGAVKRIPAVTKWQSDKYLENCAGDRSFRATSGGAPLSANFSLPAYQEYCNNFASFEESPLYLFDRTAFTSNTEWPNDFFPEFYQRCPYWDPSIDAAQIEKQTEEKEATRIGHDLFSLLGDAERPDHTWLITGPKRSGSIFHIDPNATHAWNACIRGRKRWIMYPPCIGAAPPGVFPSPSGDEFAVPLSVGEWLLQYWDEHLRRGRRSVPPDQRPLECTVEPGDLMFVPHGWWHMVINLDEGPNIAITHNYVSYSNLGNVLLFLKRKQDQISGCRDRVESIKPEFLYNEFVKSLQRGIDMGTINANELEKALAQSDWTCKAWSNSNEDTQQDKDEHSKRTYCSNNYTDPSKRPKPETDSEPGPMSIMAKTENVYAFSFSFSLT